MIIFLSVVLLLVIGVFAYVRLPRFGSLPKGERLTRIKKSPHYMDGSFKNISHTPDLTEGVSYYGVIREFLFSKKERKRPVDSLPSVKTNVKTTDTKDEFLVWFGHSSYFIQTDGKKILVDPVFSGGASPLWFTTRSFLGTDTYTAADMPELDYLFITHDHWDHLDYETIINLKHKTQNIICGLGTGAHFERWGFDKTRIHEMDWHEALNLEAGFTVTAIPARHFSGRGFRRNKSLWCSFVWQTPTMKIFIGGDSGYDSHFDETGKIHGPFDLAILENGQYDKSWKYIHMMPGEVLQAARDLRAQRILPVHSAKFTLGNHAWDEPLKLITSLNRDGQFMVITPVIGERVNLKDTSQTFSAWWESYY